MKAALAAFVSGLLFALGLGIGGMLSPSNVIGFLDVGGNWNPMLLGVMGGAVGVYALVRWGVLRAMRRPVFAEGFPSLGRTRIDRNLVAGAALFGAGWGLTGYCPGPAFSSLSALSPVTLAFVAAMLAGMWLHALLSARQAQSQPAPAPVPSSDVAQGFSTPPRG